MLNVTTKIKTISTQTIVYKTLFFWLILTAHLPLIINPPTKKDRATKNEVKKSINCLNSPKN